MTTTDVLPMPVGGSPIRCVEMHTSGEPTRIVYDGLPRLQGTLLEQRALFRERHDHLRRRILLEPRGHNDMYGAVLCPDTELTRSGEADIGVLFMHNEGLSTMCGHATIALGRFIVDNQHNTAVLPAGRQLVYQPESASVLVRLHAPCGLVLITVPTVGDDGRRADTSRPVSFVSVAVFATGLDVTIEIPAELRWPQLGGHTSVTGDFSYGGSFYFLTTPEELGFPAGLAEPDAAGMGLATTRLKAAANANPELRRYFRHPQSEEMGYLYSVMLVERGRSAAGAAEGRETGLCFFAKQQIDRSPTGGAVAARMALAHARGVRQVGERWRYDSLLSRAHDGVGSFVGCIVEEGLMPAGDGSSMPFVRVRVEGDAFYTGHHIFVSEEEDRVGRDGFSLTDVGL